MEGKSEYEGYVEIELSSKVSELHALIEFEEVITDKFKILNNGYAIACTPSITPLLIYICLHYRLPMSMKQEANVTLKTLLRDDIVSVRLI